MARWRHSVARRHREELEMNHGKILSRAWTLVWNARALWLFGFLFALAGGGGGFQTAQRLGNGGGARPKPNRHPPLPPHTLLPSNRNAAGRAAPPPLTALLPPGLNLPTVPDP